MAGDGYYTAHTGHYEWYTPIGLVDKARQALGGAIDLDPFTHPVANEIVQAQHIITEQENNQCFPIQKFLKRRTRNKDRWRDF